MVRSFPLHPVFSCEVKLTLNLVREKEEEDVFKSDEPDGYVGGDEKDDDDGEEDARASGERKMTTPKMKKKRSGAKDSRRPRGHQRGS